MALVAIERVREHCKVDDSESDLLLTIYTEAAEAACSQRANRYFYADQAAFTEALDGLQAKMDAAYDAYAAAMTAATEIADSSKRETAERIAIRALDEAMIDQSRTLNGMVANNLVLTGILLTAAHFYRNREAVSTGQGAAAVELPLGAAAIFDHLCYGIPQL